MKPTLQELANIRSKTEELEARADYRFWAEAGAFYGLEVVGFTNRSDCVFRDKETGSSFNVGPMKNFFLKAVDNAFRLKSLDK